jgi:hypothetical protein
MISVEPDAAVVGPLPKREHASRLAPPCGKRLDGRQRCTPPEVI